jgi:hypothetical protein
MTFKKNKKPCQVNSNMGMEIKILQIAHDVVTL